MKKWFSKWFKALFFPKKIYGRKLKREEGNFGFAIRNISIASLIQGILMGIVSLVIFSFPIVYGLKNLPAITFGYKMGIFFLLIFLVILTGIFGLIIFSALIHGFSKLFKGKGKYGKLIYNISLFQSAIIILGGLFSLFSLIPKIGGTVTNILIFAFNIYGLYPLTIAIKETHKLKTILAILAWAIIFIIIFLIIFIIFPSFVKTQATFVNY